MNIYSPGDCYVLRIMNEGPVKEDDELLFLYSPDLESQLNRAVMRKEELEICVREFKDGRKDEWEKLQVELLAQLQIQLDAQRNLQKHAVAEVESGRSNQLVLDRANLALSNTESLFLQQQQAVREFDRERNEAFDDIASKTRHVEDEIDRLNKLKLRMTIKSPFAGKFSPDCAVGLFCGIGDSLATLEA